MGIEVTFDSIIIDPRLPQEIFDFHSPLVSIESRKNSFTLKYSKDVDFQFDIKIRKPVWWNTTSRIILNNNPYIHDGSLSSEDDQFIVIKIDKSKRPIIIKLA